MSRRTRTVLALSSAVVAIAATVVWLSHDGLAAVPGEQPRGLADASAQATAPPAAAASSEEGTGTSPTDSGMSAEDLAFAQMRGQPLVIRGVVPGEDTVFGVVTGIEGTAGHPVLVIDLAQLLPADEGATGTPDDLLFFNDVEEQVRFPVAEDVRISTLGPLPTHPQSFEDWRAEREGAVRAGDPPVAVWVQLSKAGAVVSIQEQELPQ